MIMLLWVSIMSLGAQVSQSLVGVDSLRIGTPFQFVIDTEFPLKEIEIPDTLSSFRVVGQSIETKGKGSIARLSIVPLRVGALSFPKLELKSARVLGSGGETDAFRVFVLRSRADADTLLREIKPLREYPAQFPFWLYMLVFVAALLLAVLLLIMAFRKPAAPPPVVLAKPAVKVQIPAHLVALQQLEELTQSGLLYRDVIAYHFRVSMILREFLETSYGFGAIQMTTSEIAESLLILRPRLMAEYLGILRYCDLVKFAKHEPAIEEIIAQTETLRTILQKTDALNHV
jgi:hypothetical protein